MIVLPLRSANGVVVQIESETARSRRSGLDADDCLDPLDGRGAQFTLLAARRRTAANMRYSPRAGKHKSLSEQRHEGRVVPGRHKDSNAAKGPQQAADPQAMPV